MTAAIWGFRCLRRSGVLLQAISPAEPAAIPLNYLLLYRHSPCCPPTSNHGGGYLLYYHLSPVLSPSSTSWPPVVEKGHLTNSGQWVASRNGVIHFWAVNCPSEAFLSIFPLDLANQQHSRWWLLCQPKTWVTDGKSHPANLERTGTESAK